jgi:glutamyl-tRNA synthetase
MEDIDKQRSKPEFADLILEDLRWLGIDWDEGPDLGGPHAPYTQSLREERYEQALAELDRNGWLYPCYCSRAELQAVASAPHGLSSEGPVYPGFCRDLTEGERAAKAAVKTPSLRFKLPERAVRFTDGIYGDLTFPPGAGGDFVVKRADGMYAYQLAVVADDAAMGITDVLRGADLLDSTPRQMLLYEALGWDVPQFAHVPLLYAADGKRLSKRDESIMLSAIRRSGTSPERVVGWLAHWSGLTDRPEPVRASELIPLFNLSRIPKDPAIVTDEAIASLIEGR